MNVTKLLVENGLSIQECNASGASVLINAVDNEDSDPQLKQFSSMCS